MEDVVCVKELQPLQRHGNDGLDVGRRQDDSFRLDDVLDVGFQELVDQWDLRFAPHHVGQVDYVFVFQFLVWNKYIKIKI